MFPSSSRAARIHGGRAYAEGKDAVYRHVYGRSNQRRQNRAHVAELQRLHEQENDRHNDYIAEDYQDSEDFPESSDIFHGSENEDNPSSSRGYENSESSSTGSQRPTMHELTLLYAAYIQERGFSYEDITTMEEIWTAIYGFPPPITYDNHVTALNKSIIQEHEHTKYFFCSMCSEGMSAGQFLCTNRRCKLYGLATKRAKRMERSEVHLVNIIPQLTDILVGNLERIIAMHRLLHEQRMEASEDRSDKRLFEGYYNNIESPSSFNDGRVKVLLSLSLDGFVPKRISKREIWPLYLRVDGLPPAEADKFINSIVAGTMLSRLKPSERMIELIFSRLDSELRSLREAPLEIVIGGVLWTVEVELFRGVADMAAQQVLFGIPRWNAEYGCSKCYIKGMRMDNTRVWIAETNEDTIMRSEESFAVDAEARQYGLTKRSFMLDFMKPCNFLGDALHVCSEGITRNRLRDLFTATSKFPGMRVAAEDIEHVRTSLLGIQSHTYAGSLILSLEDLPTCKGSEVDELAAVHIAIDADLYIPKFSRVAFAELDESEKTRVRQSSDVPYSRLVINGKVYSSAKYWKRAKKTRQDLVYLKGEDAREQVEAYGSIILFLHNTSTNTVRVLLEEYRTCNAFENLHNRVNHFSHRARRIGLAVMREVIENNSYFRQKTETVIRLRSAKLINGSCSTIDYGTHTFICRL